MRLSSRPDFFTLLRTGKELLAFARDGIYTVGTQGLRLKTAFHFKAPDYGIIARRLQDGRLVLADLHTLYEYDGNELRELASGINLIKDVMIDRWDRLWMATYQGLYCFFNRGFTNHRLADKDDIVRALAVDGNDRLVMGSLNGKLMAGGKLIEDNPDNFYAPNSVTIDGKVYMAGKDDVACYADGNLHRLGLPPDRYQFVSKAGNRLIIGSRKCIAAYHPESGAVDTLSTEIPHPWCAAEDAQGRLWVGSTFGLFADGRQYDYAQKLIVTTMERDAQGNILLASKDSLFMIRHGQVSPLAMPELAGHEVRSLHVSPKGYLVVAVIDGLFVSRFGQDYNIADTRFFDHNNGFTALEPLMAMMAETSDGTVWLAGVEEMSSFSPERLLDYRPENTFIAPPLRWWQHWWVALLAVVLLSMAVWVMARWIEKRRNRKRLIRLEREKEEKARQISAIRKKAIEAVEEERLRAGAATGVLARDIVRMTEATDDTRLVMRTVNGTMLMNAADIAYFKADGNYSQMVSFQKTEIILTGLGKLEKTLNPQIFVRADRSTLVNIHNISHLNAKSRTCTFRSADNIEVETTLLAPAFKRLEAML
ncbi:MAG: LytTR family transcriptional regulator DNA-binding domain-containing protein [Bacteroidales bacterium]|nr:LytTR family transcriptional regulator DNA-binding domain-containing protein [Bacteroidales bacterium]